MELWKCVCMPEMNADIILKSKLNFAKITKMTRSESKFLASPPGGSIQITKCAQIRSICSQFPIYHSTMNATHTKELVMRYHQRLI